MKAIDLQFSNKSAMAHTITAMVNKYFTENKLSKKGNAQLFSKAAFFFVGFWVCWYLLLYTDLSVFVKIPLCALAAFFASGIGFNIMHDGNHGSFAEGKRAWINQVAGATSESLGVSCGIWRTKHNVAHHDGVNVVGIDEDIEAWPLLRLHEEQPRYWIHRYQQWYWPIAYSLLYFIWPLKDFVKYFKGKVLEQPLRFKPIDHVLFWGGKVFFAVMFFWIPIARLGVHGWLVGFLVFGGMLGLLLSIVFQPAHVVRGVKNSTFTQAQYGESMEHQIAHTADFAPTNRFLSWWVGGLNFQIEHHVFRRVAHVHLSAIHQIVKKVCAEFNYPMTVFPTVSAALAAHVGKLKDLGKS